MTQGRPRVAIVFPADEEQGFRTKVEQSRLAFVADALSAADIEVLGAPYSDHLVVEVRTLLLGVDGVLVWHNPIEGGRDRSILNAMLREVAAKGTFIGAHPDVIDRIGTKEVLYRTRGMSWGCDTRLYSSMEAMRAELPVSLNSGPRVLKQIRGHSGDGIWKLELAASSPETILRVRHAKRGHVEERMELEAFMELCRPYFAANSAMIDQAYQARLPEGMVRCYIVGDEVAGFGEQRVVALHPAQLQSGPRLYFPPTRPDFQRLKDKLEREWIGELCQVVGLAPSQLPVLWDADFLYGPKDEAGQDTFVLCEINVSSVYPFPQDALQPLVTSTLARIKS